MRTIPRFWGIHAEPGEWRGRVLGCIPFALILGVYVYFSHVRHAENPDDKLLPTIRQMASATYDIALVPDKRTGTRLMARDTAVSLRRLGIGMSISAVAGLLVGMNMGVFRGMRALCGAALTFVSIIPPLSILPILFITFGVDELSKVMLIILGTWPVITLYIADTVAKLPRSQITKSLTLGANQFSIVYRVILPQVLPSLITVVRLTLGAAWIFLIAAEAIAATEGLGYRIYLVRRYLAMDIIIPYVLWITLLGLAMDRGLEAIQRRFFRWYTETK